MSCSSTSARRASSSASATTPDIPAEEDLVVRAARLLATSYEVYDGVGIAIKKRIPVQGGLGGGSSDAATVLVALNQLWRLDLRIDQLAALGLQLGADVPIFVRGHSAWAEGVGEQLTPCDFPEQRISGAQTGQPE